MRRKQFYRRVVYMEVTDVATVKTAVLSCGHSRRLDQRRTGTYAKFVACPTCTSTRNNKQPN